MSCTSKLKELVAFALAFSMLSDQEIRDIYMKCRGHYLHLLDTYQVDLKQQNIQTIMKNEQE